MPTLRLMPLSGINTVAEDAALQRGGDEPRLYVRDAVNVNITPAGKLDIRAGVNKVSSAKLSHLWHSPLHADTFAVLGGDLVKIDANDWSTEALAHIGEGDTSYMVLNNRVIVAGPAGIFAYNGVTAERMTIDTPPAPMAITMDGGSLVSGSYGIALSWLRGKFESAVSAITHVVVADGERIDVSLPICFDSTVTHARVYVTKPDGGRLGKLEDYAISNASVSYTLFDDTGIQPQFQYCEPMPTGRYLSYWRGRILTAKANVINFSEPMAYHIHDYRHGFIQMPQRVTFLAPADGGIWVGQVDHVVFLQGTDPNQMEFRRKSARAPVPGSVVYLDADTAGQNDQGGATTVAWLADNGYVVGTAGGEVVENSSGVLNGITADTGASVVFGERLLTIINS